MADAIGEETFGQIDNVARLIAEEEDFVRSFIDSIRDWEWGIVVGYDFENQTVDVKLKNYPEVPPLQNVPISYTGEGLRIHQPITASNQPQPESGESEVEDGTMGRIMWADSYALDAFDHRHETPMRDNFDKPKVIPARHRGRQAVFVPDSPVLRTEDKPSYLGEEGAALDENDVQEDDTAFVHENDDGSFSYVLFKSNGSVVIRAKSIKLVDENGDVTTLDGVAREGDAVEDDLGNQVGTIAESSDTVSSI